MKISLDFGAINIRRPPSQPPKTDVSHGPYLSRRGIYISGTCRDSFGINFIKMEYYSINSIECGFVEYQQKGGHARI